jgi:hypothetical protein
MTASLEKSILMFEQVLNQFPEDRDAIIELYANSGTFRKICADYAEMTIWLERQKQSGKQSTGMYHYAAELLKELEDELGKCLEGKQTAVAMETRQPADQSEEPLSTHP